MKIGISQMLKALYAAEAQEGLKTTLLGIGPMSHRLIRAAFELAQEKDFPLMFIASRNQVDSMELGGGYVCGWDQERFCKAIDDEARRIDFKGLYYKCRDHGGPWQRDNERMAALDENQAMDIGKESYLADMIHGFDLLHIDPTKDPHETGIVPMNKVIRRTLELIEYVEEERKRRNLPAIGYEVGTEETNGGLTSQESYKGFIEELARLLKEKGLPIPDFIVGQTGTLVRMTENAGHFNEGTAALLADTARRYGVGLKEHNSDYLSDHALLCHPGIGITAANVAPEFGVVETRAYLELAALEKKEGEQGRLKTISKVASIIPQKAVRGQRWRKWMLGEASKRSLEEVGKDADLTAAITEICGHYTFDDAEVKEEIAAMFANIKSLDVDPEKYVTDKIKESINRYVYCFGLEGVTSKIRKYL